jgi:hypothetical protein
MIPPYILLLVCSFLNLARAQTQSQIQSCGNSINMISYDSYPSMSTTDTTHYYNATYTYSVSACTTPKKVPVTKINLIDYNNNIIYSCTLTQFDTTGSLYTQCQRTLGEMATTAQQNAANNAAAGTSDDPPPDCKSPPLAPGVSSVDESGGANGQSTFRSGLAKSPPSTPSTTTSTSTTTPLPPRPAECPGGA